MAQAAAEGRATLSARARAATLLAAGALTLAACAPLVRDALLTLDDYRYLRLLRDVRSGTPGAWIQALVVENRWDDCWWIEPGTFVRFFRPLVAPLYAADQALWGMEPLGFTATNVALHLAATALALACFARLLHPAAAVLATLAFAAHAAHYENLFYVAGRTDTLAGIAFLGTLWLHLRVRQRASHRGQLAVAGACFAALLCREYSLVLPPLLVLLDLWRPPGSEPRTLARALRRNATLLAATALLLLLYLVLRQLAFGDGGSGTRPFPYFNLPGHDGFAARTLATWTQYAAGLASGMFVQTFLLDLRQLEAHLGGADVALALLLHGMLAIGLWQRATRFWAVLLLATLVPMCLVYSSARYLYLPSLGWCALLGMLAGQALERGKRARAAAVVLVALCIALPAWRLHAILAWWPAKLAQPVLPQVEYPAMVERGDWMPRADRPLLVLDFPGGWYEIQFLADTLAVELDRPMPRTRVLTVLPPRREVVATAARAIDAHTVELWRGGQPLVENMAGDFPRRALAPGTIVPGEGFTLEVVETAAAGATRVRVRLEQPLREVDLCRCGRDANGRWALRRVSA